MPFPHLPCRQRHRHCFTSFLQTYRSCRVSISSSARTLKTPRRGSTCRRGLRTWRCSTWATRSRRRPRGSCSSRTRRAWWRPCSCPSCATTTRTRSCGGTTPTSTSGRCAAPNLKASTHMELPWSSMLTLSRLTLSGSESVRAVCACLDPAIGRSFPSTVQCLTVHGKCTVALLTLALF